MREQSYLQTPKSRSLVVARDIAKKNRHQCRDSFSETGHEASLLTLQTLRHPRGKHTMTTIRPLFDRVLVQRNDEPSKTTSGLFLPETASKEKPAEGTILAIGTGRIGDDGTVTPLIVKKGDCIVFGKYAGTEIKIDGEDRLILREDDILGVIES